MLGETKDAVGRRIAAAARQLQSVNPTLTLAQAQDRVLSERPELYRAFKEAPEPPPVRTFSTPAASGPRSFEERAVGGLEPMVRQIMLADATLSRAQATVRALDRFPELAAAVSDARRRDGVGVQQRNTGALPRPPQWDNPSAAADAMAQNASPETWEGWTMQPAIAGAQRGQPMPIGSAGREPTRPEVEGSALGRFPTAEALPRPTGMPMLRASEELSPERQEGAWDRLMPKLSQVFSEHGLPPPSQVLEHLARAARARGQ
jgi:hypothetical protein